MSDVKSTESEHHLAFQECPNCRENYATCDCSKEQIEKCREDTLCKCGHDMRDHVRKIQTGKYTDCLECNNCSECGESKDCKCKEFREDTKSESMKFDNAKDAEEYLENEAKEGETIFLDEKATSTQPRRVGSFTKDTLHAPNKEEIKKNIEKKFLGIRGWKDWEEYDKIGESSELDKNIRWELIDIAIDETQKFREDRQGVVGGKE